MTKKPKVTKKEMYLLLSGVLLGFFMQLLYDTLREESFYQNIMSTSYWRVVLTISCGVLLFLMFRRLEAKS